MNIFVTAINPEQCAQDYCDSHVNKMLLETTQLLCTAHHAHGSTFPGIYKPSHMNHPSSIWVRERCMNYMWTVELLCALHQEYEFRTGNVHGCKMILDYLVHIPASIQESGKPMEFIFVGPDDCFPERTVVARYRELYRRKFQSFKRPMQWTKRHPPIWMGPAATKPTRSHRA